MLTYKNLTTFSILLLVFFSILNLVSSNVLSTKGILVASQEKEILKIEKENRYLKTQIEESARLADIEDYSRQMGYVSSTNTVYLQTNAGFALK